MLLLLYSLLCFAGGLVGSLIPKLSLDIVFPDNTAFPAYARPQEIIPPQGLKQVTFCLWTVHNSGHTHTWFSYALANNYEHVLFKYNPEKKQLSYVFQDNSRTIDRLSLDLNKWYHTCVAWSMETNVLKVYINGHTIQEASLDGGSHKRHPLIGNGSIVLGQYQGTFKGTDAMKGRISRLQVWNRTLTVEEIKSQMSCDAEEGNILAWSHSSWSFSSAVVIVPSSVPCIENQDQRKKRSGRSIVHINARGVPNELDNEDDVQQAVEPKVNNYFNFFV